MIHKELIGILRHSLGLTRGTEAYRNYYAAEPDDPQCTALVMAGYMRVGADIPGGLVYYHVTDEGKKIAYGT